MNETQAKEIGEAFVKLFETNDHHGVLSDDVFVDINVPQWRFQLQGADKVMEWLRGALPNASRVAAIRTDPTPTGLVMEIDQRIDHHEGEYLSLNLHRLEVVDGQVTEWTMYCTGDWSPELRERHAKEAPMIRT